MHAYMCTYALTWTGSTHSERESESERVGLIFKQDALKVEIELGLDRETLYSP